jgi:hypothetical protein
MANSPSSDPQQSGSDRQETVLVVVDDPTLQTTILDYFVDNKRPVARRCSAGRWPDKRSQLCRAPAIPCLKES